MTLTYYGSTAVSTSANPPLEVFCAVGGKVQYPGDLTTAVKGSKVWLYISTNVPADLSAANTITDGGKLGMTPGDFLIGVFTGSPAGAGTTGGSTEMYTYRGVLNTTDAILTSTSGYRLSSLYST